MFWLWQAVLWVVSTVAIHYLAPRSRPDDVKPGALSDFNLPMIGEGTPLPVLFGTCKLDAPKIRWWGDYSTHPIKDHDVVVGHRYRFGADFWLCHGPIDEVVGIVLDGRIYSPAGGFISAGSTLRVSDGGGAVTVELPGGWSRQLGTLAADVTTALNAALPGFGRVVYAFDVPTGTTLDFVIVDDGTTYTCSAAVPEGSYLSGFDLARQLGPAMRAAMQAVSGCPVFNAWWIYEALTARFALTLMGAGSVEFWIDPDSPVLPFLGLAHTGAKVFDVVAPGILEVQVGDYAVRPTRYFFDLGAGVTVHWDESSAAALFGMDANAADFTAPQCCTHTRTGGTGRGIAITDYGDYFRVSVSLPDIYGGDGVGGAGGVVGDFDVYKGTQTQGVSDYLLTGHPAITAESFFPGGASNVTIAPAFAGLGTPQSAYPGVCHAVARAVYWGNQTTIRSFGFVLRATPNPLELTDGGEELDGDGNAANLLWALGTDRIWGPGVAEELIDRDALVTLGDATAAEGFGISMLIDRPSTALDLSNEVCRHIEATPVVDPITGLYGYRLVRPDYDPASLPEVDESMLSDVRFSRPSWGKTKTSARVQFISRALGYVEDSYVLDNDAAIAAQGGRREIEDLDFRALSTTRNAAAAAGRELGPLSYACAVLAANCDRNLWQQTPSGVIAFTSARLGITRMPMRIATLDPGTLEDGHIEFTAVEDVFGISYTGFGGEAPADAGKGEPRTFVVGLADPSGTPHLISQALAAHGERLWGLSGVRVFGDGFDDSLITVGNQLVNTGRHCLVPDGEGGFYLAIQTTTLEIWAQRISANGEPLWGNGVVVLSSALGQTYVGSQAPKCVPLGTHGLMVLWGDDRRIGGYHQDLYVQRLDVDGVPRLEANGLRFWQQSGAYTNTAVYDAVPDGDDEGGAFATICIDGASPSIVHLDRNGGRESSTTGPLQLCTTAYNGPRTMLIQDGGRNTGAVAMLETAIGEFTTNGSWLQRTAGSLYRLWGGTGLSLGASPSGGGFMILGVALLLDDNGEPWVAANDPRGVPVLAKPSLTASSTTAVPERLIDLGVLVGDACDLIRDGAGGFYVATWSDPGGLTLYTRFVVHHVLPTRLDWSVEVDPFTPVTSSPRGPFQSTGFLTPDGAGGVIVVFSQSFGIPAVSHLLRAQRLDASGNRLWGDAGVEIAPGESIVNYLVVAP